LFLFIFIDDKNVYLNFLRGIAVEKVVIYARVSTNDQTTEDQILKLRSIVEKNG
jgi:predicted site-specific integrase-resolvase